MILTISTILQIYLEYHLEWNRKILFLIKTNQVSRASLKEDPKVDAGACL